MLATAPLRSPTVLLIEDDRPLRRVLVRALSDAGYEVLAADRGKRGLEQVGQGRADMVILDLNLPDMDGLQVIREIRRQSRVPVLVLSGRHAESDKILLLNAGADDYLCKPFSQGELAARIGVALRRRKPDDTPVERFGIGELEIDFGCRTVKVSRQMIRLTPIEFELLAVLARNAGRIVTHQQLLRSVWGADQTHQLHYLRVQMSNLRKKIDADPNRPGYIVTEPTLGYRLPV